MERNPKTPPKPCFALEQNEKNPLCKDCYCKKECAELMGHLALRVDVDRVPFHFMPPGFVKPRKRTASQDPDFDKIDSLYRFCYEWVFEEKTYSKVYEFKEIIYQQANAANTSIKMFLLTNMIGWKKAHPGTVFSPVQLVAEFAVEQVQTYAETCNRKFGVFDTTSLDRLMGSNLAKQDFEAHLLNSEIIFGSWVINYKLFHMGNLMANFYREKEIALDPYWLAIEPSYYNLILGPYLDEPDESISNLLRQHRSNTSRVRARMMKSSQKAIATFGARENVMPEAIRFVLAQRGLRPEHFQLDNLPVLDAARFWSCLGSAIQQYECLKFVDNSPSVFDRHFKRVNSVLS